MLSDIGNGPMWQLRWPTQQLRDRLDGAKKSVTFPNKPKGMWYRTFTRLQRQARDVEEQSLAAMQGWVARNVGRQ